MAQVVDTSDFRPGIKIKWEGQLCEIVDCQHHKMGRGGAIIRTKLRNLITGSIIEQSFKSGERFERITFDTKPAQFMYHDDDNYYFMDLSDYDQLPLTSASVGQAAGFMTENLEVELLYCEGRLMSIEMPKSVILKVVQTPPAFKGDTVNAGTKPATLETGMVVQVPMFINEGEAIVVDTRTGSYLERAK